MPTKPAYWKYLEFNPHRSGRDEVRIAGTGVAVWAVVMDWRNVGDDLEQLAYDFQVSEPAIQAALAYYRENKALIDARIDA